MGKLTTHVLDTHAGVPAAAMTIELYSLASGHAVRIAREVTGKDGRCAGPLIESPAFEAGRYELVFKTADYFRGKGLVLPDPAFIEEARVAIGIAWPDQHYHIPLLITPWSYSVYRGG